MESMELPPFLSSEPMQGEPPCRWADFLSPKLRRFPRDGQRVRWVKFLGHGAEGIVCRVRFGDDNQHFALKTFFYTAPLPLSASDRYGLGMWSLEGEARMVASLEQVCSGLRQASHSPVFVPKQRITRLDALSSLYACSDEGRQSRVFGDLPEDQKVSLSDMFASTRVRRCYGWIRLGGEALMHLNRLISWDKRLERKGELIPAFFEPERHYYGIVYEYIPPATLEVDAVQRQIDFFYYAGFHSFQPVNVVNWQGPGIKLDFGDYSTPVDPKCEMIHYFWAPAKASYILGLNPPHPTLSDEEDDAQHKTGFFRDTANLDRSMAVETAYCSKYYARWRGSQSPPDEEQLVADILQVHGLSVPPEMMPKVVRNAWKQYLRSKEQYLKWLVEIGQGPKRIGT